MKDSTVKDRDSAVDISEIKSNEYRNSFKRIKCVSSLLTLSVLLLFSIFCYSVLITEFLHFLWLEIMLSVLDIAWIVYLVKKIKTEKRFFEFDKVQLDKEALVYIKPDIYRYYKQLNDIIYFSVPVFMIGVLGFLSFTVTSSKVSGGISYQIALFFALCIFVLLYLFIKALLILYCGVPYIGAKERAGMRKKLIGTTALCFIYWLAVCGVLLLGVIPHHRARFVCVIFGIMYFAVGITDNLRRKGFSFSSQNKKTAAVCAVSVALLLVMGFAYVEFDLLTPYAEAYQKVPYVKDKIEYNSENGNFTVTTGKDEFKILQLSDIHLGGSPISLTKDKKALDACYKLISDAKPDMVIVTGDMVFSVGLISVSFNNYTQVTAFCDFMESVGIPWAFTYGNHDTEFLSTANISEIDSLYLSASYINNGILLYPDKKPDVYGRCNQCIEIRNEDGSLREALYLIDSNAVTGIRANVYDGVHDDQVKWYEDSVKELTERYGSVPNSLIYTHVPPFEVMEAYELSRTSSDKIEVISGRTATGIIGRKITTQREDCKLFDSVKQLGSTKAVFFGHDHLTTLNMKYEGIQLCYGLSVDYITRPTVGKNTYQRGGTTVTLKQDGTYTVSQKLLIDIEETENKQ